VSATPSIITEEGNIRIHNQEGARIPIFFEDENGDPRVMGGVTVAFIGEHGFRRVLEEGVAANEKVLKLRPGDFADQVDKMFEFVVRDESIEEMPTLWRGRVIVEGW
jgi:hypothetical protein